jgi:hypothetical protein
MFWPCLAVEFNSNKFEKHTPAQIDSDSLRKAVYMRVFSGFKCFRKYEVLTNFTSNFAPPPGGRNWGGGGGGGGGGGRNSGDTGFKVSGHGTKLRRFNLILSASSLGVQTATHNMFSMLKARKWIMKENKIYRLLTLCSRKLYWKMSNACIPKAHSHSKSGGSIWVSLECQLMLFLNSWRVSSRIVRLTLQLFKNSIDTQGKFRLNLHSLNVSELSKYRRNKLSIPHVHICWFWAIILLLRLQTTAQALPVLYTSLFFRFHSID